MRSSLARYAARAANFVLAVRPHNGLSAQSAPGDTGNQPQGSAGISRGRAVWLVTGMIIAGVFLAAAGAYAQSLGDVARKEEARRKTVKKPSRIYTNDNLKSVDPPSEPVPSPEPQATATPAAPDASAAATTPAANDASARDEKYWRNRLDTERTALARAQTLQEALQSRINALSTDFVNRDDPAQRSVITADRQKALAELERVKKEAAQHQKAIADIQEEGRRAGIPAGWLR
jgi:hypothetical protein